MQLEISKKYRKYSLDTDYNKNIYNKVITLSGWLKKLFDMNYLDAFKLYYNNCKPLDIIDFEGKIITSSKDTKSFHFLYNETLIETEKESLKFMAENCYLKLGDQNSFPKGLFKRK